EPLQAFPAIQVLKGEIPLQAEVMRCRFHQYGLQEGDALPLREDSANPVSIITGAGFLDPCYGDLLRACYHNLEWPISRPAPPSRRFWRSSRTENFPPPSNRSTAPCFPSARCWC